VWSQTVPIVMVLLTCAQAACAPAVRSTLARPLGDREAAQLWSPAADPAVRDLFYGPGGRELAPDTAAAYMFLAKDTAGYSDGYDVAGPEGLEWSVKIGEEAQSEVVASRLMWAAGFHQPPTYYLPSWRLVGGPEPGLKGPARFRPKLAWLDKTGEWAWHRNPFVATQPFRGLVVLNLMLNNADLRTPNNAIYDLPVLREGARRWYVVRDLGASLGATAFIYGTRNDVEGFQRQGFVTRSGDGLVEFDYHGRHGELLRILTPADVRWAAERWAALTPAQWHAAFAAGGYGPAIAGRYIAKLQEKIAQGLSLDAAF
jgi:hypothetical protein